jgi:hypothetical protein
MTVRAKHKKKTRRVARTNRSCRAGEKFSERVMPTVSDFDILVIGRNLQLETLIGALP